MNRRAAATAVVLGAAGLLLFRFGRGDLRGWVGDVLVVVFLAALPAAARLGRPWQRLLAVGILSVGTELFQGLHLVGPGSHWLLHLTLGSTFDPWDLLMYAVGLAVAVAAERWWAAGH